MPVALISTSTSPALGPSISMVSTVKGSPAFQATAARVFMMSCQMMGGAVLPYYERARHAEPRIFHPCRDRAEPLNRFFDVSVFLRLVDDLEEGAQNVLYTFARLRGEHHRCFPAGFFQLCDLCLDCVLGHCVRFRERNNLRLFRQSLSVCLKFVANNSVGSPRIFRGPVNEVQQYTTALRVAQKPVAQSCSFVCAFDQAGQIGHHEFASIRFNDTELRMQRCKWVIGDLRLCRTHCSEEGGLAGIRKPDQTGVGNQL